MVRMRHHLMRGVYVIGAMKDTRLNYIQVRQLKANKVLYPLEQSIPAVEVCATNRVFVLTTMR